jgi:E3 ubiquitin-protein ligase NRDP1
MGYDLNRFEEGTVDEELICPICSFVLEDPCQAPECEHAFCSSCIHQWLKLQCICPVDRTPIQPKDLKAVPRILKNLLSKLKLKCNHADLGCTAYVRLENLNSHSNECEFNPRKPVACNLGCDMFVAKEELKSHNCVKELRKIIDDQQSKINLLSQEVVKQKSELDMYICELRSLKSSASKIFRYSNNNTCNNNNNNNNSSSNNNTNMDRIINNNNNIDDIIRWSSSLNVARITRWGGIISTPDAVLQAIIKRALMENGCPSSIVNELMENAHERKWPPGLSTLETRQINRNHYVNFVCKRIPNKQAVLILAGKYILFFHFKKNLKIIFIYFNNS